MTRTSVLLAVLVAGTALAPASAPSSAGVEGVWRYQGEIDRRTDGSTVTTGPAEGYDGFLIFTRNGYMSSTLLPKGRTWKRDTVTPEQLREMFEQSSAHAGRYKVDTAKHVLNIEATVSLDPAEEGQWGDVGYTLDQDTLTLSGPWTYKGETLTFNLRLTRVK